MTDGTPADDDGATRNANLVELHRQLVALAARIDYAVGDAPDLAHVKALEEQHVAIAARATAVQRVLFAAQTAEIEKAALAVSAALPKVEGALDDLADLAAFVGSTTDVLALVDHAVATARMV